MSLLYTLVFSSKCRSTHHKLAVDALRRLSVDNAEDWRAFFLHHHEAYLRGAKAPDAEFKDFRNHVLHVREGEWGGAIESAEEWRLRTARALAAGDWAHAARCAGVMSHYIVDPHQPFHTHQTEEEGVIHRAVEWSLCKSYDDLQTLLVDELGGYPELSVGGGEDWLAQLVREGARESTKSYELIIDHYDFQKGVKTPKLGIDREIKEKVALLIGRAVSALACALDRIIVESKAKPPKYPEALQAFMVALDAPLQTILGAFESAGERKLVAAMYEEYRRTGKVRETLPEDDRVVRALYAQEVLKTPISSLDAKWPREIGAKHEAGAGVRAAKPKKAVAAKPKPETKAETTARVPPSDVVETAAAPLAQSVVPDTPAAPPAQGEGELVLDTPLPKEKSAKGRKAAPVKVFTLSAASPVVDAPSIGPKTAKRLASLGVNTVSDLLSVSPATAAVLLGARHITAQTIHDWQSQAELACTIPSLKSREAQALVACDIRTALALANADAGVLAAQWSAWAVSSAAERVWGDAPAPSQDDVSEMVRRAKMVVTDEKKRAETAN